jgi:phosphoglycerate dehydrogenase-like enzyme
MAEHVLAMTLALAKRLLVEQQKLRHGEFDQFTPNRLLTGMTAGILGFGGIGRATARLMRAFGMRIYTINTSGVSSEPIDFLGTLHDLEHVLRQNNVVVVALPLTKATRGLIGKNELAWMKPDGHPGKRRARRDSRRGGALHARQEPSELPGWHRRLVDRAFPTRDVSHGISLPRSP